MVKQEKLAIGIPLKICLKQGGKKMGFTRRHRRIKEVHGRNIDDPVEDELNDSTAYGEVMSSLFGWTSSEEQEERVEHLNELSRELAREKRQKQLKNKKKT
jgi:hypothetical protein